MADLRSALHDLTTLSEEDLLARYRDEPEALRLLMAHLATAADRSTQEYQLKYYRVRNPMALPVHTSLARDVACVGGNRAGKTVTALAELAIQVTGCIPESLKTVYPREKIRAPIRARVVANSFIDTIEPIIKRKLRWDEWNGVGEPADGRGHWGLIPRHCLAGGTWDKAYSEKHRTLTLTVDSYWQGSGGIRMTRGHSTVQFNSYDQEPSVFSGSSLHLVVHDELPPADIYRENRMRTMDVKGRIITAFTPPDEAGISRGDVSWFYDEIYERGLPGPGKSPDIDTVVIHTEANTVLDEREVVERMATLTDEQREVRMHGRFAHLSGVIYPLFTQRMQWWCFKCQKKTYPVESACPSCASLDIAEYTHVIEPYPVPKHWPTIFVIDPHPRKDDALGWFAITPTDDLIMVGEAQLNGTADDIAKGVKEWEERNLPRHTIVKRLMDPNIALETNDKLKRGWTLRQAYDAAGLRCDLANDEMNVGISAVRELLKPDPFQRRPRLQLFRSCERMIYGLSHWSWDDHTRADDREVKERPRDRHKDYPDLIRYLALDRPSYRNYTVGYAFHHQRSGRHPLLGY